MAPATNYRPFFQALKAPIDYSLKSFEWLFVNSPPLLIIALFVIASWRFVGRGFAIASGFVFFLLGFLGLWEDMMVTMALVVASVLFCTLLGLPLGVICAKNTKAYRWLRPLLDAMQTTPSFVYLVPIVMLFSIGNTAGVLATIIFSLPPLVRLTALGIMQVNPDLKEAAIAMGGTKKQILFRIELPLALPSILAGLNQTIMMALSMVVAAALIGAGGLGSPVVQGLNTLDIGMAIRGGMGIVGVAVILDRITLGISKRFSNS